LGKKILVGIVAIFILGAIFIWSPSFTGLFGLSVGGKEVKIGAILPLSTKGGQVGQDWMRGILLAQSISDKNSANLRLTVFFEDDKCSAKEALSAYQNLKQRGVNIFLGPGCSTGALAVGPVAQNDGSLLFTPGAGTDKVVQIGDFIFRNNASSSRKAIAVADFAKTRFKNIAIIYDASTDAFVDEKNSFISQAAKDNIRITSENAFVGSESDFKTILLKSLDGKPDAVYIAAIMPNAAIIVKQLKGIDENVQILTTEPMAADGTFIKATGSLSEKIIFSTTDFGRENDPTFWDTYVHEYGVQPSIYSAQAYDNFMILNQIISTNCQTGNSVCIKNNLRELSNYFGASGKISIGANGDAEKELVIKVIKNGELIKYQAD
jgi:branched-chain amino acid transport system substrate-binding protein